MKLEIDNTWTLFLDRDGVINIEKYKDYTHHWGEFVFYSAAAENIAALSRLFGYTVVVTNQKGVGKGVTKAVDVDDIHQRMCAAVLAYNGKIDAVFYCPDLADDSPCRKPNTGMALQAKATIPAIDFTKSLMVGNNISDVQFGKTMGMYTAFLRTTHPEIVLPQGLVDFEAKDLAGLAEMILEGRAHRL